MERWRDRVRKLGGRQRNPADIHLAAAYPDLARHVLIPSEVKPIPSLRHVKLHEFDRYLGSGVYQTPEIVAAELTDVTLCTVNNVVLTPRRNVVVESISPGLRVDSVRHDAIPRTSRQLDGLCTLLRHVLLNPQNPGPFQTYYHSVVDNLSRFAILRMPYFRRYDRIRLIAPGGLSTVEARLIERLAPDNVEVVPVDTTECIRPDRYLFLSFVTGFSCGYLPAQVVQLWREAFQFPSKRPTRRLLISRERAAIRRIRNHAQLVDALRPFGFESVCPEMLPIDEQIELFGSAKTVVAPHGAGLSNILFMPPGNVVELAGTEFLPPHFATLAASLGHSHTALLGTNERRNHDFDVDVAAVVRMVKDLP